MTFANGDVANGEEVATELALSKTQLQLIMDLDKNNAVAFTRSNYDNISWDVFENSTYYDSGNSSNVRLNETAKLVALKVDSTNQVYAADFTGASRDGTYTYVPTSNPGEATWTFDAANNEEDGTSVSANNDEAWLVLNTQYREGQVIWKVGNLVNFDTGSFLVTGDVTGNWIEIASPYYIRLTKEAGAVHLESSTDGSSWTERIAWTETSSIGSASDVKIGIGNFNRGLYFVAFGVQVELTQTDNIHSCSLQSWTINGLQSSGYFCSNDVTAGSDARAVVSHWNVTAGGSGSSTSVDFSADSGSNYETNLTNSGFKTISNTGTALTIKLNFNKDTAGVKSPYFTAYGYQWTEE